MQTDFLDKGHQEDLWKGENREWEELPNCPYVRHFLNQLTFNPMSLLKSMRSSLFKGMGIICGGGSAYVEQIISRNDREALSLDLEAIGGDMWAVIDRESDHLKASDQQKHQAASE